MNKTEQELSIFALGGLFEIGKNMYVIQSFDDIVVIDCGSKLPDESLLGINLIIQDISYLKENQDKIRALIVTHGDREHIGGILYFLKQLQVPVYAPNLIHGLIVNRLEEYDLLDKVMLYMIDADSKLRNGTIKTTFFHTSYSNPDSLGIAFQTPQGLIVHTGYFNFDWSIVNQESPDIQKIAEISQDGVLLLLSDSTNAEKAGYTLTEQKIADDIEGAFRRATQKIFISTITSNIQRIQQIINASEKTNRKLVLLGPNMINAVSVALDLRYLTIPVGMLIESHEISRYDPDQVTILCTGCQGEPRSALARLAGSGYDDVNVLPKDTVIFAANPIPGNERIVLRIIDQLFLLGANVIYGASKIKGMKVSGHARQEELKLMITLLKPKYFIPISGEYRMLHQHSLLAETVGIKKENIFILNNGDVVDFVHQEAVQERRIPTGNVFAEELRVGDVHEVVLHDQSMVSEDGMLIIITTIRKQDGKIISGPHTISHGFIHDTESTDLMNEVNNYVRATIDRIQNNTNSERILKEAIKNTAQQILVAQSNRRPMILPIIIDM
ncbi:ribonuclease J [Psychrobacillus sp. FSL H8-0484]|uniref:ribonuclease J n=1 Tax=Psychrobacillus sp. FSL H8-0484 TaxID=2921390 RepID=UPI0030FBB78F